MITTRQLRKNDDRSAFFSGNVNLDRFFRLFAGQNQFRHHIGTTYVAVEQDEIVGFVTVSVGHIEIDQLPKSIRPPHRYPLPILRIARLAVAQSSQKRGIGKELLKYSFHLAYELNDRYGCCGVVVDAKPERIDFYSRYGFEPMEVVAGELGERPQLVPMFIPLGEIPQPFR
jgi:GNAT superfamily N-acetyltransferase